MFLKKLIPVRICVTAGVLFLLPAAPGFSHPSGTADASGATDTKNDCSPLPVINPRKDFLQNFNTACYAQVLDSSKANGGSSGDTNAVYEQAYYQVIPGYELVVIGTFPNARFQSVEVYDSHTLRTSSAADYELLPLTSSMINPFEPGAKWVENQQYGVTVGFGSPPPTNVAPGCSTADTTIDSNFLDASQIHPGVTWTGYPDLPPNFPPHQTGANSAGNLMVRRYQDISSNPGTVVIVRQLSDGCGVPLKTAIQDGIITVNKDTGSDWLNQPQINAHKAFAGEIEPVYCYPPDPMNAVMWMRGPDFVSGADDYGAYLKWAIPDGFIPSLTAAGQFIRIQFPGPIVPNIPCSDGNCTLTGNEQLRYFSFSFVNGGNTVISVKDSDMVRDPDGNIALIFGIGTPPPHYVKAANYYTYIDLTEYKGYALSTTLNIRNIMPNEKFECSTANVPFFTSEYNPKGGFMGPRVPTVDFPTAAQIPMFPVPVERPNSCLAVPVKPPMICGGNQVGARGSIPR